MKKKLYFLLLLITTFPAFSQKKIPSIFVENIRGERVSSSSLINENGATIISFWATWCKPCIKEMDAIQQEMETWLKEKNIRFVAVSVDDARSKNRVPTLATSKNWKWEIFYDTNADFQRTMNVLSIPHTFIVDKTGKIVHQQTTFTIGDESTYWQILKNL